MPNSRPGVAAISARLQIIEGQDHTAATCRVVEPGHAVDCVEVQSARRQGSSERSVFPITDQGHARTCELSIPWGCSRQPGCRAEQEDEARLAVADRHYGFARTRQMT